MPALRSGLLLAAVVVLALLAVTAQALAVLWHQPVQHGAWRVGLSAVVLAGVWWLLNGPLEGPTLLRLSSTHGFTVGDVLGVPAVVAGAVVLVLAARA